jgi:poly(3-hydroxybutyrate) depolymerase
MSKPIEWFANNLISTVPWQHAGGGRRVYPGFVQLSAFISMNRQRHENAFRDYYHQLVAGDFDRADVTRVFYEEYLAVADLAAEFYLETVAKVFQEFALPLGLLTYRGRKVNAAAIRKTAARNRIEAVQTAQRQGWL